MKTAFYQEFCCRVQAVSLLLMYTVYNATLRTISDLCGRPVGRHQVSHHCRQVVAPERALGLPVIAEHGTVERVVDAEVAQVALQSRLPVDEVKYLLRSWPSGDR